MSGLFLPPAVSRELADERQAFEAEVLGRAVRDYMLKVKSILDEFNYELRQIDPRLEMMRAPDQGCEGTPLKAGYYFVMRHNEGAPPSVLVIEGPNGEFREPDSGVFEQLKKNDLWNPATEKRAAERRRRIEAAEESRKEQERKDRQRDIYERWLAASRTQVSMNRDTPWHQNAAGRRGAKK